MARTELTTGELIRSYRDGRGWSRKRLADEVQRSASWIAQVERGEIKLTDVTVLGKVAAVLGAPLQEFIDAALGPDAEKVRERPYVEMLRLAIAGHPAPHSITTPVAVGGLVDIEPFRQRTARVWERVHASAYQELCPEIARLITELEAATRKAPREQRPELLPLLSRTYQAAAAVLVKVGDRGAGWVSADRSIVAAERSHDPALILAGQLRMARTLLDSSEKNLARHVLIQAIGNYDAIIAGKDPAMASLAGSCALLLAVLHARDENDRDAEQCLMFARQLAGMLGANHNYHDTEFGPTNVSMHAVAVAVELGNGQQAIDRAAHVRDTAQLSPERQARYLVDVARAHVLTRSLQNAVLELTRAEQIAPQELAESPLVETILDDIDALLKRRIIPGLRELRQRLYG